MTDAQTEARAIARCVRGCATDDQYIELVERIATALAAKDAELAAEQAALRLAADRADRAEAALAEARKPLEWTELSTGWIAHTSFHAYEVVKTDQGFMATYANRDFAWGAEDAMKVAAQADYERRILTALEATPPAPKVTEAMVRMTISETIRAMGANPDEQIIGELTVFDAVAVKVRAALTAAQEAGKP